MSSLTVRPASKHSSISTSVPSGHFSADEAGHRKYCVRDGDNVGFIEDDIFHCWDMAEDVVVAVAVGACESLPLREVGGLDIGIKFSLIGGRDGESLTILFGLTEICIELRIGLPMDGDVLDCWYFGDKDAEGDEARTLDWLTKEFMDGLELGVTKYVGEDSKSLAFAEGVEDKYDIMVEGVNDDSVTFSSTVEEEVKEGGAVEPDFSSFSFGTVHIGLPPTTSSTLHPLLPLSNEMTIVLLMRGQRKHPQGVDSNSLVNSEVGL